jgi:hypothetical protein
MSGVLVPLFERLPEIYRARDAEQVPANPLRAYLGAFEAAFGAVHADIAQLYENLFIDTCDDWVIPYLADLVGTSHLKGLPRTLRADVADTIALRRRKGTLAAIERLAFDLTGWASHAVELRENIAWTQHLNHLRPDAGGGPPTAAFTQPPRGGTAPIRSPRTLSLLGTAFDPFAYLADTRTARNPAGTDLRNVNLPNLAIFLWRLEAYRLSLTRPLLKDIVDRGAQPEGMARLVLRFDLHPLNLPVRLFNAGRADVSAAAIDAAVTLTGPDEVPAPMLSARLTGPATDASVATYVAIDYFDDSGDEPVGFDVGDAGLHLFFPDRLQPLQWLIRGANLCAWETGLRQPLRSSEIAIDPIIGRIAIGLDTEAQRDALVSRVDGTPVPAWYASFNYGSPGPVGAHPISRDQPVAGDATSIDVGGAHTLKTLQEALVGLDATLQDTVIVIHDSFVHRLNLPELRLAHSLTILAAANERPIVLLAQPLAFRPAVITADTADVPSVRLDGLYIAPDPQSFATGEALISRAALSALEIVGCTLAPGGHSLRDGTRAPMQPALALANGYGFEDDRERNDFVPTPRILLQKSVAGPIAIDDRYTLIVEQSIVDAGAGVGDTSARIAIGPASSGASSWSAALDFDGITCFGAVRARRLSGMGGLFAQRIEAFDNQHGCIKSSWFGGSGNRLPPNHSCLVASDAHLAFTSERHNDPGYAQVTRTSDTRILTLGPDDDTMGAFGFQLEAHKWINLQVRLREFMPVGIRPLLLPLS